jgi:hypothetical protein
MCGLILLAQGLAVSQAGAQVLVYRLEITEETGINYHPFEGGYFTAPLLGGSGTFLLTSTDGDRTFTESADSGRLFTALDGKEKKAVISATTGGEDTAQGALVALGKIDHQLKVNGPIVNLSIKVAKSLSGTAVSSDDESTASAPADDGSIGSAGVSQIRLVLDEPQTNYANDHGLSLSQTVEELKLELGRQGYNNGSEATPAPTAGTATTSSAATTTVTAAPTTSGQ